MYEAVQKIMADGVARNAKKIAKDINKVGLSKYKAKPANLTTHLTTLTRKGKFKRIKLGVYQSLNGAYHD